MDDWLAVFVTLLKLVWKVYVFLQKLMYILNSIQQDMSATNEFFFHHFIPLMCANMCTKLHGHRINDWESPSFEEPLKSPVERGLNKLSLASYVKISGLSHNLDSKNTNTMKLFWR